MLIFSQNMDSPTCLVMSIVHSRRPLALASPSRASALTRAAISLSLADPVLFLLTKPVREPNYLSIFQNRFYEVASLETNQILVCSIAISDINLWAFNNLPRFLYET